MSEVTLLDPLVSETPPPAASDVEPLAPTGAAAIEEPPAEGQEPAAEQALAPDGPERDSAEYYTAIQAKVDAREPLTTEERGDYQSAVDRSRAQQQARQLTQQTRQQLDTLARGFTPGLVEAARATLGLARDEDLSDSDRLAVIQLSQNLSGRAMEFVDQVEPLVLFSHEVQLRDAITQLDPSGAAAILSSLDTATRPVERFARTLAAYGDVRARLSAAQSDAGKRASKAERERDALKVEVEKLKAARAQGNPPGSIGNAAPNRLWSTKVQARTLHVQGKISNSEMRTIEADASVPEL